MWKSRNGFLQECFPYVELRVLIVCMYTARYCSKYENVQRISCTLFLNKCQLVNLELVLFHGFIIITFTTNLDNSWLCYFCNPEFFQAWSSPLIYCFLRCKPGKTANVNCWNLFLLSSYNKDLSKLRPASRVFHVSLPSFATGKQTLLEGNFLSRSDRNFSDFCTVQKPQSVSCKQKNITQGIGSSWHVVWSGETVTPNAYWSMLYCCIYDFLPLVREHPKI